jgi:hypothetical protein
MTTVKIDHPHAEVIAAYYSGKKVQYAINDSDWVDWNGSSGFALETQARWRIKPEPLVRWVAVRGLQCGVMFSERRSAEAWVAGCPNPNEYRIVRMVEQPE